MDNYDYQGLTISEVAQRLSVSTRTVHRYLKKGLLEATKDGLSPKAFLQYIAGGHLRSEWDGNPTTDLDLFLHTLQKGIVKGSVDWEGDGDIEDVLTNRSL